MVAKESEIPQGASYPYVALSTAMLVADAVKLAGGTKSPVQKSLLAHTLKEDEKSQGFTFKIGASKCYRLIEGRSAFTLTEEAKRYFYPTSDQDRSEALLSFFSAPPAFSEIIKRFDGTKLPGSDMLANLFHRELRVPESWAGRAASFFIRAAQQVGAVDEQGFLRFNAARQGMAQSAHEAVSEAVAAVEPQASGATARQGPPVEAIGTGYHPYVLPLPNDRKVVIHAPLDITAKEIKRLQKWIEFTLQIDWGEKDES